MRVICLAIGFTILSNIRSRLVNADHEVLNATNKEAVLLVIDVQNCFIEGGTLAVNGGRALVPLINQLVLNYRPYFKEVIYTMDFHPPDHVSFASQHSNKSAFQTITLKYNENSKICQPIELKNSDNRAVDCSSNTIKEIEQILWPDHCVNGTEDSNFAPGLFFDESKDTIFRKATNKDIDSYSVFMDNGHLAKTELDGMLKSKQIKQLFMVGIATDYCVKNAALDARDLGYEVYVILDLTKGISETTTDKAIKDMVEKGVKIIQYKDLEIILSGN